MKLSVAIFLAFSVSGCAVMNTGEVDYRRASATPMVIRSEGSCPPSENLRRAAECQPLQASRLELKNFPTGRPIGPTEVFSVSIDHGLIADMVEPKFALRRAVQLKNPLHRIGEIVILANVFEFPEASSAEGVGFLQFPDFKAAKVVYYNPDVQEKQDLSFSNIPILPPTEYHGRPVGIQVVILELDRVSEPMKGLLKKMEQLGQTSGLVPGGAVSQTLFQLGSSMLASENDDIIFEHRFVLDPPSADSKAVTPTLEEGFYVLRRQEERDQSMVWRNVILDPNTGELKLAISAKGNPDPRIAEYSPFDQSTYLTLNVKRHDRSALSSVGSPTLAQLNEKIAEAANLRGAALTAATDAIEAQIGDTAAKNRLRTLLQKWGAVEVAGVRYGATTTTGGLACNAQQSQLTEVTLKSSLGEFRNALITVDEAPAVPDTDRRAMLVRIAGYLAPAQDPLNSDLLSNPDAFLAEARDRWPEMATAIVKTIRANRGRAACS